MLNSLYFFFGRMNPITRGHSRLVREMKELAQRDMADIRIYLTHTQNHYSDPICYQDKIKYAKQVFGSMVVESDVRDIFSLFAALEKEFEAVHWCVGSDRFKEAARICGHNGSEFNFKDCSPCQVIRCSNTDQIDETSVSASAVRTLARKGEVLEAIKWLPDELPMEIKLEICNKIRECK